jgi:hypothetical protein
MMGHPIARFVGWATWVLVVMAVIFIDQRRRANATDQYGYAISDDVSIANYIIAAVLCGGLVFPVYFWSTRKSALGVVIGVGFMVVAGMIASAATLLAAMVL